MLFRPMTDPVPPALAERGLESLQALEGLSGYDQLELTCRQVVGILTAYRTAFAGSQERHLEFDALCEGVLEWLETEIAPLRFSRPH